MNNKQLIIPIRLIFIVFISILLINAIAAEPQYKILDKDNVASDGLSFRYQNYVISVDHFYTFDEYERIVCDIFKNVKHDSDEKVSLRIDFYYKQEAWTVLEKVLGNIGVDPNIILAASYGRWSEPDMLLVSLHVFRDENGNRLDENMVIKFDHVCDCEK